MKFLQSTDRLSTESRRQTLNDLPRPVLFVIYDKVRGRKPQPHVPTTVDLITEDRQPGIHDVNV